MDRIPLSNQTYREKTFYDSNKILKKTANLIINLLNSSINYSNICMKYFLIFDSTVF